MEAANEISTLVQEIGIPMVTALLFAAGGWWLIRYILTSIVTKITDQGMETEDRIKQLHNIVIALIDKNQLLANDLLKLDTMIRVKWQISPDERRITRNPDDKVK